MMWRRWQAFRQRLYPGF
ncbi:UNVERIFIED_CONTAM: hypothetical protein GTU68_016816 [Idotea baltica]|nr:hypothetical protein [Idotea baltica]